MYDRVTEKKYVTINLINATSSAATVAVSAISRADRVIAMTKKFCLLVIRRDAHEFQMFEDAIYV